MLESLGKPPSQSFPPMASLLPWAPGMGQECLGPPTGPTRRGRLCFAAALQLPDKRSYLRATAALMLGSAPVLSHPGGTWGWLSPAPPFLWALSHPVPLVWAQWSGLMPHRPPLFLPC